MKPVFFLGAILALIVYTPSQAALTQDKQNELLMRGEYLSYLGDCVGCHSVRGGKPLAGGLGFNSPFGVLYSTNITPDPKTGIGRYSFEQFDRAMRKGVRADGQNLYPAMPYPSYAKIIPDDIQALYAYFMQGVTPVEQPNKPNQMKWPFSMRWTLSMWNMLFLDDKPFKPDTSKSEQWNRGAYIVQGLGHCGSCHTPRGSIAFQEKAGSQDGANGDLFLAGAIVDAWNAVNLRGLWTEPDIVQFLKTGQNAQATAYGSMTDIIYFSTQHLTEADLRAIATYLTSLPAPAGSVASKPMLAAAPKPAGDSLYKTPGGLGYVQFCATCHKKDGRGVAGIFPPLAGNVSLLAKDPTSVIHVTLSGWLSAATKDNPRIVGMPEFGSLTDEELAQILTFMRTAWGNQGEAITSKEVKKLRGEIQLKPAGPSEFVTPRFAGMLQSPNAQQLVQGMRFMTETKALLPEYVGNELNCSSCHLNGGTVAGASPFVGLSAVFPTYNPRAGRVFDLKDRNNGCFQRSMNGMPLPKDSEKMEATVAYFDWMKGTFKKGDKIPGRGTAKVDQKVIPNKENGKKVYANQCAVCHGAGGEGLKQPDGTYAFTALWGLEAFNLGAGMARTHKAAGFVKSNMPMGVSQKFPLGQGDLTDQEAVDVAVFFSHKERPDFPDKAKDWPKGGKPKDARY